MADVLSVIHLKMIQNWLKPGRALSIIENFSLKICDCNFFSTYCTREYLLEGSSGGHPE